MGGFRTAKAIQARHHNYEKPDSELFLSMASLWEIGILHGLGRIELKLSISDIADLADSEFATPLLPIEPAHIDCLMGLPFHHRDPFDRLLIAQSLTIQAAIIGKDERFNAYGVQRVW
jgi:PIN domain nuclease of toxin-antitoxin system